MSTTTISRSSRTVATVIVVLMFAVGGAIGYFALGGNNRAPANAVTPQEKSGTCLLCASGLSGSGGNLSGGGGNAPANPGPSGSGGDGGRLSTR